MPKFKTRAQKLEEMVKWLLLERTALEAQYFLARTDSSVNREASEGELRKATEAMRSMNSSVAVVRMNDYYGLDVGRDVLDWYREE